MSVIIVVPHRVHILPQGGTVIETKFGPNSTGL